MKTFQRIKNGAKMPVDNYVTDLLFIIGILAGSTVIDDLPALLIVFYIPLNLIYYYYIGSTEKVKQ